jgi:hypothetical protein
MPYWIASTLAATPAFVWIFLGLGLPAALALLPRKDWHDRPLVFCTAFALGPALLTAWMFVLGTVGAAQNVALMRFDLVFTGTLFMAFIAAALAWRKRKSPVPAPSRSPLAFEEKLLVALVVVALVVRWLDIAYWPFTAYDALWVYGYQGRLYTLLGHIPQTIGYYPQFLSLQYTYGQLAVGAIDDHAARAGLLFLEIGSILAVYVLGSRLFNRRAGIFAAALWALYPHVGEWSRYGDLEIALTFLFTAASAFFLMAWTNQPPRRHYAAIAGVMFGIALWTKPTAGAFVWGVLLLLVIELVRLRLDWRAWLPRLETAAITGIASAPLGLVWYVRNVLLGHSPVDFPPAFWISQAARSGIEFGWPLLALFVLLAYLYLGPHAARPDTRRGLIGLVLVLAGLVPSIRVPHRMGIIEWLLLAAGAALLAVTLLPYARNRWTDASRTLALRLGWVLALALPYFITWFYSYSYHFRLSFAVVPLLLLPTAVLLACWLKPDALARPLRRLSVSLAFIVLAVPGIIAPLHDINAGWDWLWTDMLPDDFARYESGNDALMNVVSGLQDYVDQTGALPVVSAPGIKRLPFFFPLADIRVDQTPTRYEQLRGVTYFVDSAPEGTGAYEEIPLLGNQILSSLDRPQIMRRAWWKDDGIFRYDVYELHLENRYDKPFVPIPTREGSVVFGGFVEMMGHDLGGSDLWPGRRITMHLYWHVLAPLPEDYRVFIHLRDRDDNLVLAWDGPVARSANGERYYSTLDWEQKEYVIDERVLSLPEGVTPVGDDYDIVIGMYNAANERLPVTISGKPAGDSYTLSEQINVVAHEP